ncbi:MAG: Zn-dependent exopeptidase M28 [Methanomassiliicoccus sp.]|nr:MAG: Zn-dependent exopeptidase M28 [Methanomassiliicoccus sp.]
MLELSVLMILRGDPILGDLLSDLPEDCLKFHDARMAEPFYMVDRQSKNMDGQPPRRWSPHLSHKWTSTRAMTLASATAMVCAVLFTASSGIMPANASSDMEAIRAIIDNVDTANVMSTVEDLEDFGSRSFVLESSRQSALYIYERFAEIGLETEIQEFTVGDAISSNVIATIPTSSGSEGLFLFGAHYDSENYLADDLTDTELLPAPGADDDASGIAAIIEMARVLVDVDLHNTVKFVAFGAEEYGYDHSGGCAGSAYFVEQEVANGETYEGSAILDMIGYRVGIDNIVTIITKEDSNLMAETTKEMIRWLDLGLKINLVKAPNIVFSDHSSFWEADFPSMLVTEEVSEYTLVPINPYYHTSLDTIDTLSEEQIGVTAQALVSSIIWLSAEDGGGASIILGIVIITVATIAVTMFFAMQRRRKK